MNTPSRVTVLAVLTTLPWWGCNALIGLGAPEPKPADSTATSSGDGGSGGTGSGFGGASGGPGTGGSGGSALGARCSAALQDCGDGLKCLPQYPGDGVCGENGMVAQGSPCTAVHPNGTFDDCAPALLCVDAVCRPVCDTATDLCAPVTTCVHQTGNFDVCIPWCDPLAQNCGEGGCYYTPQGRKEGWVCTVPGMVVEDAPCFGPYINECVPGTTCATCGGGTYCCKPFCDTNQPAMYCSGDDTCTGAFESPYDHIGICIP